MSSSYFWSELQKTILENAYAIGGLSKAQEDLPEKKRAAIATQACRMKITNPKPRLHKSRTD